MEKVARMKRELEAAKAARAGSDGIIYKGEPPLLGEKLIHQVVAK